jgi:single-strand DNA-binding protein
MNQDSNGSNNYGNSSQDVFGGFEEDITPVDDGEMPF